MSVEIKTERYSDIRVTNGLIDKLVHELLEIEGGWTEWVESEFPDNGSRKVSARFDKFYKTRDGKHTIVAIAYVSPGKRSYTVMPNILDVDGYRLQLESPSIRPSMLALGKVVRAVCGGVSDRMYELRRQPNRLVVSAAMRNPYLDLVIPCIHYEDTIFHNLHKRMLGDQYVSENWIKGFIDNQGVFMNSKEAMNVARERRQLRKKGLEDNLEPKHIY